MGLRPKYSRISIVPSGDSDGHILLNFSDEQKSKIDDGDLTIHRSLSLVGVGGMAADVTHWGTYTGYDPENYIEGVSSDHTKVSYHLARLGTPGEDTFQFYAALAFHRFTKDVKTWSVVTSLALILL
ncbi:hypothetical protein KBI52_19945 [Microvirga sp. HBU67558]|uniref:hypothetical protein n=1 Tax=Microvirga sp. HBU67558 TaxID=2824562 RepID=UPI001B37D1BF|nr:hypothetical protein [Microvirga sp. HBU67558]MBQ0822468.1 hypothetical protein [Microvirga sp. HBU67558]